MNEKRVASRKERIIFENMIRSDVQSASRKNETNDNRINNREENDNYSNKGHYNRNVPESSNSKMVNGTPMSREIEYTNKNRFGSNVINSNNKKKSKRDKIWEEKEKTR